MLMLLKEQFDACKACRFGARSSQQPAVLFTGQGARSAPNRCFASCGGKALSQLGGSLRCLDEPHMYLGITEFECLIHDFCASLIPGLLSHVPFAAFPKQGGKAGLADYLNTNPIEVDVRIKMRPLRLRQDMRRC